MSRKDRIINLQKLVEQTIDDGATTVEQVHSAIASMPFDVLERIEGLQKPVSKARDIHDDTVGNIYETIRLLNDRSGEIARRLLGERSGKN